MVVPFPRSGDTEPCELLHKLRLDRGWSLMGVARAMRAAATDDEKKGLPDLDSLKANWRRWEKGRVEPDRGRLTPFYKPIIARMFGLTPEVIWPQTADALAAQMPRFAAPVQYRDELASRRQAVHEAISKLEQELAYLNAILAVPVPAEM